MSKELLNSASPISIESIYAAIRDNGFSEQTTQLIDNFTNDILNGKTNKKENQITNPIKSLITYSL